MAIFCQLICFVQIINFKRKIQKFYFFYQKSCFQFSPLKIKVSPILTNIMTDKNTLNDNMLCRYQDYLHPTLKRNSSDPKIRNYTKKLTSHRHHLSGLYNPLALNKRNNSTLELNDHAKKTEKIKLQKLFPKNLIIQFQEVLDTIPNNRNHTMNRKNNCSKKTISPFKVFEIAQNKFYFDKKNENKKTSEKIKLNQSTSSDIYSLFNIKSIKMMKKSIQSPMTIKQDANFQSNQNNVQRKLNKYDRGLKYSTNCIFQDQKQNPVAKDIIKNNCSQRFYRNTQNLNQLQSFEKNYIKGYDELLPLKLIQNKLNEDNINQMESKTSNRSSSIIVNHKKKKNSKELTPMVFASKQCNNSSTLQDNKFDSRFMRKKSHLVFEEKFIKYISMLKINAKIHGIEIQFPQTYSRHQFNFFVGNGNNSKLIKDTLKKRWWLGSCEQKKDLRKNNVIWTQLKDKSYYVSNEKQNSSSDIEDSQKRLIIHNHFEQNQFLGNKKALFYNMKSYYTKIGKDPFSYLPLTFHIKTLSDQTWNSFLNYYNKFIEENPEGKNIWILKPGQNSNRGNGITVHQSIESIKAVVCQCEKQGRTFILQKYIEKPFLYNKRKFDIRCYMLLARLNSKIKGFWYKQGYIRTSGYYQNPFIHLTNDAIQQNCDNYGKYEDKNKLSYDAFQKYLDDNFNMKEEARKYDFQRDITPKLKKVCIDSIKASYKYIGNQRQGLPTFELFGLDFMIDQNFNPWLIEINTNPCLQTEGRVLQKIIVPLVDNVFKLTIDCVFPPPTFWSNSTKHLISKNVDKNHFQLVFEESQGSQKGHLNNLIKENSMDKIGQIDEDSQIYEEDQQ